MSQFLDQSHFKKIDRTIHAMTKDGWQVVRYDRAGKWYLEHPGKGQKIRILLAAAVKHATKKGSVFFTDRPGGKAFDARVRKVIRGALMKRMTYIKNGNDYPALKVLPYDHEGNRAEMESAVKIRCIIKQEGLTIFDGHVQPLDEEDFRLPLPGIEKAMNHAKDGTIFSYQYEITFWDGNDGEVIATYPVPGPAEIEVQS